MNGTKTILLALLLMISFSISAQTDSAFAYADYAFSHLDDTTQRHFPRTETDRLYLGKRMSAFVNHRQMVAVIKTMQETKDAAFAADVKQNLVSGGFFADNETGILTYVAPAGLNKYLIEEKIPVFNWSVQQDTMEIKGYACQKATCHFRGRDYEAWFCPQLPYSGGPWKFRGLPGLILEVQDTQKEVSFKFIGFAQGSDISSYSIPAGMEKITQKAYDQYIASLNRDAQAMRGAATASGGTYVTGRASGTGNGPPKRIKIMNNPIEKKQSDERKN